MSDALRLGLIHYLAYIEIVGRMGWHNRAAEGADCCCLTTHLLYVRMDKALTFANASNLFLTSAVRKVKYSSRRQPRANGSMAWADDMSCPFFQTLERGALGLIGTMPIPKLTVVL